ncbi:MAG: phosphatase PAP2 family protein [Clostridia bacterium]|nr:phosphatase PAP2 family protein [Clostridia bacterium]
MKQSLKRKIVLTIKKNMKWIILFISMILFFTIIEDVLDNEIWAFDNIVYETISHIISTPVTAILKVITNLGGAIGIITVTILILIFLKSNIQKFYVVLNLLIITMSNQILKYIIQRPRPIEHRIIDQSGYSFPSGHSMVSMAFYGFLIYLIYKNVENKYIKWGLCTLLSILILSIGISRIYLGVHYASDVIGGFCLSISYLIVYTKMIGKDIKNKGV